MLVQGWMPGIGILFIYFRHSELSPAATFLLALVDVNATDISRECVSPFKLSCRATKFRSFSGECNNVGNPHWGKALTPFSRSADADYSDRVAGPRSTSAGLQLPSARAISRTVNGNADEKLHKYVNQMLVVWAQLVEADTARPAYFTGTYLPTKSTQFSALLRFFVVVIE